MSTTITSGAHPPQPQPQAQQAPAWQKDEDVSQCPICESGFTWWYRKHHCRSCGKVTCADCSANQSLLPKARVCQRPQTPLIEDLRHPVTRVASTRRGSATSLQRQQARRDSSHEEQQPEGVELVRTCDVCFSRLEQERCRRTLGIDLDALEPRLAALMIRQHTAGLSGTARAAPVIDAAAAPASTASTRTPRRIPQPRTTHSPPPSYGTASAATQTTAHGHHRRSRARHSADGAGSSAPSRHATVAGSQTTTTTTAAPAIASPVTVAPLRYAPFTVAGEDKICGEECPICFEEYEPGTKAARLECWCVYHLACITAWRDSKGGAGRCPLHFHDGLQS